MISFSQTAECHSERTGKKSIREKPKKRKKRRIVGFGGGGKMTCEQKCPTLSFMFCHVMTEIITSVIGLFIKTRFCIQSTSIPAFLILSQAVDQDERKIKLYIEKLLIELCCL